MQVTVFALAGETRHGERQALEAVLLAPPSPEAT